MDEFVMRNYLLLKKSADMKVRIQLRKGEIVAPEKCDLCNTPCTPISFHKDLLQPLEVIWLCRKCKIAEYMKM